MADITVTSIHHVSVMPPDDQRDPTALYILPINVAKRDQVLGALMDRWSDVEQTLLSMLQKMLDADYNLAATVFFNTSNSMQYRELINSVAELKCHEPDRKAISTFMERLKRFATKRNRIVHGAWVPQHSIGADELGRPVVAETHWRRVSWHSSPEKREAILRDPKAQNEFWFTVDDIARIARDITILREDLLNFLVKTWGQGQPLGQPEQ